MTTFYLDYEGGNDANDGLTFANRWKTITNGATAARIAPGDTIRVMASPDPTSIGTATWTGGGRPAAKTISSSTNATPIVVTVTAHGFSTGDYVSIVSHATNTNANGVWKVGTTTANTFEILQMDGSNTTGNGAGTGGNATKVSNCFVKLASPVTQNIALCGGLGQKPAWTATTNASSVQISTTYKEGYGSISVGVSAAFTTGKAAYYTLPSTLDLSSYQQVCFWVYQNLGTVGAAGATYLALCTDTTGDTVAHTCNVPALGTTGIWVPVVVNLGANLNTAIQSVAFYVATDNGQQTFYLDNIIAAKASSSADSLNLTSLISKSDGTGDEAWYAIQSINYDAVMLANDSGQLSTSASIRGYNGSTGSATTYKRETTKIAAATANSSVQAVQDDGVAGNPITFSGGWNRTDMSTQTGQTWYDGQNSWGYGLGLSARSYITLDRLNFCRYNIGINFLSIGTGNAIGSCYATANTGGVYVYPAVHSLYTFTNLWVNNNSTGLQLYGSGHSVTSIKTCENNGNYGVYLACYQTSFGSIVAGNTATSSSRAAIYCEAALNTVIASATVTNNAAAPSFTLGLTAAGSGAAQLTVNGGSSSGSTSTVTVNTGSIARFNNFTMSETTEVGTITLGQGYVYSNRHDNTDGNNWQWQGSGTINQQTSVVDSPATSSWKMNPTTTNATATSPLWLKLGTVVCAASSLVTVTARMRRSNTGLTMRLICPGGQIVGVTNDVYSDMTAAADTWETVTITFTPTKPGGVDIYAYAFGGTTYSGYVCNLTASQA